MQEQIPSNITPEQGWSSMKAILDREMPAQKRSRRFIFFWWSAALIMLVGLSGFFVMNHDSVRAQPTTPVEENKVQPTEPGTKDKSVSEQKEIFALQESNENPSMHSASSTHSSLKSHNPSTKPLVKFNYKITSPENVNANSNTATLTSTQHETISSTIALTDENVVVAEDEIPVGEPVTRNEEEGNENYIAESIQTLDIVPLPIPEEVANDNIISVATPVYSIGNGNEIKMHKHKVAFSPNVELATLAGTKGSGLYAGVGLDTKLSSKFEVAAAIGYRTFDPSSAIFTGNNKSHEAGLEQNDIIGSSPSYDNNGPYVVADRLSSATYNQVNPVVRDLHQWQTQLGMSWKMTKKFALEAGAGLSFSTQAFTEYPILSGTVSTGGNFLASNVLNDYDLVRGSNFSFYGGLAYQISKNLSAKLQWWQTNQNYLLTEAVDPFGAPAQDEDRDDFVRGLNFGLKYSIL